MMELSGYRAPDGVNLVADEAGPRDGPAVILLHGGGQTRHSWSGAMVALVGRGYRVVNFDARGHGDSDWSQAGRYSLDDRVGDLQTITSQLSVPFALVGASLGGATAIHAVAQGMEPAAVVLVDIVPRPEPVGIDRIVGFMRSTLGGFDTIEDAITAVAAYNPHRERPSDPEGLMRNLRTREDGRLYWHYDPRIVVAEPEIHHHEVERSSLALAERPEMPVLLVRGLSSDVVSDEGVAAFREVLPDLQVADVSGAGHMVSGDRNDAFNASVIAFLDRVLQPGRVA
jgi:pimeloyl-ACP methyl ester carboxylesterase